MKKIVLFFAAVAALASCVKENTLVPEQTDTNLVTITAVSADTKTVLDGTDVVWENTDVIKVVLDQKVELQDFSVSTATGSTATFQGQFDNPVTASEAYAVYPASAVVYVYDADKTVISHSLPTVQNGVVSSEMNLSYAVLDAEELAAGNATAIFNNALALVKIKVPAGVASVTLTSSNETLAGDAEFYAPTTSMGRTSVQSGSKSVTLSRGGEALNAENDVLVYPASTGSLKVTIVGTDGTEYEKSVNDIKFEASQYRTLDLTKLFYMDVEADSEVPVSSMGGTYEVEVYAAAVDAYTVEIEDGKTWVQHKETKAFNGKTIVFNIEPNTTTSTRKAEVTISWDGGSRNFTISQEGKAELSFVYVDPEDPESGLIQWEETFDIYTSYLNAQNKLSPVKTHKNVFTISLSEGAEMEHGTYKIENIFYANRQTQGTKGGTYFANYSDGVLTIKTDENDGAIRSYYFTNDIELTYDKEAKTFALADPVAYGFDYFNSDLKEGYIGNYSVIVKPDVSDSPLAKFEGFWTEKYGSVVNNSLEVSVDGDKLLFKNMFLYPGYTNYSGAYYGTLSADGKTITLDQEYSTHGMYGPLSYFGSIILTVNADGSLSTDSAFGNSVNNYKATKN